MKKLSLTLIVLFTAVSQGVLPAAARDSSNPVRAPRIVAQDQATEGFISLSPRRKINYRYFPGNPNKPTLLLVNGLIFDLDNWNEFIRTMNEAGYTLIQFAFSAQPESLQGLKGEDPDFLASGLDLEDLSNEILAVYNQFQKRGKVQLYTLSYGAVGVEFATRHRDKVDRLIMTSPLVIPLEKYDPSGKLTDFWLNGYRDAFRWMDPFGLWSTFWYETAYQIIWGNYLNDRMDARAKENPYYFPSGIKKEVFKKSVFHLVRASRDFDLRDYTKQPLPSTHLMLASEEEPQALNDQLEVWERLPTKTQGSLSFFAGAYHALPGAHPVESATWIDALVDVRDGKSRIAPGSVYYINMESGRAVPVAYKDLKDAIQKSQKENAKN